jgi:hypothetical protein
MMTRRAKRGRDEVKMSFFVPKPLVRDVRLRALKDEVPLRVVFIRALTAYLQRKKGGS